MKINLLKSLMITTLVFSFMTVKTQAAIGLVSSGPAATIFIALGGGSTLVSAWGHSTSGYDPKTFENLIGLIGLVFLDHIEDDLSETLMSHYNFLDYSTAFQLAVLIKSKIEDDSTIPKDKKYILQISATELMNILIHTDLSSDEKEIITNDFIY